MDNENGGLDPSARQRKTAAEIARKKVLASYAQKTQSESKNNSDTPQITKEEWSKYHSAWQKYYQKYYSEYYSKAARNYIATEKFKQQRAAEDDRKLLEDDTVVAQTPNQKINTIIGADAPSTKERVKSKLRHQIQEQATKQAKKSKRHRHLIPILAGVSAILIFLFLQYNRLIFAPIAAYVSPGENAATVITPVDAVITVSDNNKLLIPKLNIDVPVHFGISNDTKTVMDAMNNGVAHFAIPGANALPGEIGNLIITGHSAGDVYSSNQYKFIFSGLERLNENDTLYINYNSTRYTYSVVSKEIVEPTDIAALTKATDKPMLTLVTCTPLGTSRYRLLIHAEQVSPTPENATASSEQNTENAPQNTTANSLPSNEATFFENIWNFLTGKS